MGIEKSKIRIGVFGEVKEQIERMSEASGKVGQRLSGAAEAFNRAVESVTGVVKRLENDHTEKKVDDAEYKAVKLYLAQLTSELSTRAKSAERQTLETKGRIDMGAGIVEMLYNKARTEASNAERFRRIEEEEEKPPPTKKKTVRRKRKKE